MVIDTKGDILLERITEKIPYGVLFIDVDDLVVYVNNKIEEIFGIDRDEILGKDYGYLEGYIKLKGERSFKELQIKNIVKDKNESVLDEKIIVSREKKRFYNLDIIPILSDEKDYRGMIFLFDRIKKEEFLREEIESTCEIWWKVHDIIGHPIMILDKDQKIIDVNKATEELLDIKDEDIIGKYCYNLFHKKEEAPERCPFLTMIESKELETQEMEVEALDRTFLISCTPVFDDGELDKVIHIGADVTKEKMTKRKLERSEKKYRELFETSKDGIAVTDLEGNILDCNEAFLDILGYDSLDEIYKKSYKSFTPEEYHEMEEEIIKNETLKKGFSKEYEKEYVTEKGERVNVKIRGWIRKDFEDETVGMWVLVRDITDRKKAEEREEFLHSLLRHDLKNKIQVIRGYHILLEDEVSEEGEEILDKAKRVVRDSQRLIEMVRNLARLERIEGYNEVFLNTYLVEAVDYNRDLAEENGFSIDIKVDSYKVRGGRLLVELFSNIVSNAIKHSGGDEIRIKAVENEDTVTVRIEDNGEGIDEEEKERILEKGYTGIESDGTGLGLFLSKRIVETFGGKIEIKDSEMGGARFDIILQKC